MLKQKNRPVFLDLRQIKMPLAALVSIGHRISGVFLFLVLPYSIYLFDLSLSSEQGFADVVQCLTSPLIRFVLFLMIWGILHHLFSGVRFLLLDIDIGLTKELAKKSALLVLFSGVISALLMSWVLL